MKIAILTDIHSNYIALQTCIKEAEIQGVEEFLFLGDYLGELAYPQRTLEELERIKQKYPCTFIRGNKERYWIDRKNGKYENVIWEAGKSGSGMLCYVYEHLALQQIEEFEKMPISKTMHYHGYPEFVICHGSPWNDNESLREDFDYIDVLTKKLETELTICGHFHIQSDYTRNGKRVINPGAVGIPLRSGGKTQFMILSGKNGKWEIQFHTLDYDVERAIQEMDEENLSEQAPAWYRVTKEVLRGGNVPQIALISKAHELYEKYTGICDWSNIPEKYWNMALSELEIPE
mgnify:CR=1 FL=1